VLQCVAVCCSVNQCVAVCCSVLQCVAVWISALQCVAVCCSRLSTPGPVYRSTCITPLGHGIAGSATCGVQGFSLKEFRHEYHALCSTTWCCGGDLRCFRCSVQEFREIIWVRELETRIAAMFAPKVFAFVTFKMTWQVREMTLSS